MRRFFGRAADYIRETDKIFLFLCIATSIYGAILVLSSTRATGSKGQFATQVIALALGVFVAIILSLLDYGEYTRFFVIFSAVALLLVGLTFVIGVTPQGTDNKAWLILPGNISFQPSELLKITFIIGMAKHITSIKQDNIGPLNLLLLCLHGGAYILLIHLQGDDGTALIFLFIFIAMLLLGGVKLRYFIAAGAAAVIALPVVWFKVLEQYQKDRIIILFNPELDLLEMGWQQWRGRIAISSGGLTGYGLFNGPHVQSQTLPKAYNDFIFASAGEELGFIGCIAIILLLLFFCIRVLRVARLSRDKLGMLICTGVFAIIASQTVMNIGMCLSLLPVIGITLPFFSAGGSSLLCLFLGVGLVLSVYMHRHERTVYLNV